MSELEKQAIKRAKQGFAIMCVNHNYEWFQCDEQPRSFDKAKRMVDELFDKCGMMAAFAIELDGWKCIYKRGGE